MKGLHHLQTLVACALLAVSLPGCSFNPHGIPNLDSLLPWRAEVPYSVPTLEELNLVYESPGLLAVYHGETCAKGKQTLKVSQRMALPRNMDQGTVLFNGYRLRNAGSDHQVKALGTGIGSIAVEGGDLTWEAAGALADVDYDTTIEWCYFFTAITWNSTTLRAEVDHADTMHAFRDRPWNAGTALRPMPGYLRNKAFEGASEVAILPRGFLAMWNGDDNNVLQFAYTQGAGETFLQSGKAYGNGETPLPSPSASLGGGDVVSWESMGFLKDNGLEWSQTLADLATAFVGADVGIINPPFHITPQEDDGIGCGSLGGGERSEERQVDDIPYEFAIPVLSGWDLAYVCEDEHVKTIGTWIPRWSWAPGPSGGSLRYTVSSVLEDDDAFPTFHSRSQIKILGFRRIAGKR